MDNLVFWVDWWSVITGGLALLAVYMIAALVIEGHKAKKWGKRRGMKE